MLWKRQENNLVMPKPLDPENTDKSKKVQSTIPPSNIMKGEYRSRDIDFYNGGLA
jgi:hypothetical protein